MGKDKQTLNAVIYLRFYFGEACAIKDQGCVWLKNRSYKMLDKVTVRLESEKDHAEVRSLITEAFGQDDEAKLVEVLRKRDEAVISLVACYEDKVIGHIMFSKMQSPEGGLGLAPVCVVPNHQNKGLGAKLIEEGLSMARDHGWRFVVVLGEPKYYGRFGFDAKLAQSFASPFAGPYLMAMELVEDTLQGKSGNLSYSKAFDEM